MTQDWHNSPLLEGATRAVTIPPGRGGGCSGGPSGQTRINKQDGASRAEQTDGGHGRAGSSEAHGCAGSSGGHGRWSLWPWPRPTRPSHYSRNSTTPPPKKKKNHGAAYGVSGALRGYPQEQGALLGLGLEAEAFTGHEVESGALTGSLSNRFHIHDRRGRRLGLASVAITRGAPNESPWTRPTWHDQ